MPRYAPVQTILYHLKTPESEEPVRTIPTIGFNVETLSYKNIKFQVWDLGGQTSIRPYWRCYFPNTDAIIFVVDCADPDRMIVAREELQMMLGEDELANAILLIFANKQDVEGAMDVAEVTKALGLTTLKRRQWSIVPTVALSGDGLFEGFDWLSTCIKGATK